MYFLDSDVDSGGIAKEFAVFQNEPMTDWAIPATDNLSIIHNQSRRLARIVELLFELAQIGTGRFRDHALRSHFRGVALSPCVLDLVRHANRTLDRLLWSVLGK